ncbi:uridine kinase [Bacillus thuringiensis]|uniref:uridine kinase n=1 Tax=Bacillus TaxID=1386 RepID=UPI00027BFF79|nr:MULTISPECIES: uridine kinase [Bacillus]EJV74909.1 uridine kinase [Bacillus cereus HuB1-1]PEW78974.1 uridine kinase [Bacillus thuringiensis]PGS64246.1 uridine kinase [Bacillus thuringiensis]HDX9688667.1 uridine kinase [Bacillus thuringiensis]
MLIIGIAGGSGAGKTTLSQLILEKTGGYGIAVISQDNYYFDQSHLTLEERKSVNYDDPKNIDNKLLLKHLLMLRQGNSVNTPIYEFNRHIRLEKTFCISPVPVIIVEGIHILSQADIREVLDMKVFIDTDGDLRVLRRIIRDVSERGRNLESVHRQYLSTVKPVYDAIIGPSRKYADIVLHGSDFKEGLSVMISYIEKFSIQSPIQNVL